MSLLLVISHAPYGNDVVWNALRLARTALEDGLDVRIFLINEGVDVARSFRPEGAEFDLTAILQGLVNDGARVKICETCLSRCGIGRGELVPQAQVAGMHDLLDWIRRSERILTF